MAEVMFEYRPQHVGDLALSMGDKVEVTRKGDDGWWTGTLRGATGNFPGKPKSRKVKKLSKLRTSASATPLCRACFDTYLTPPCVCGCLVLLLAPLGLTFVSQSGSCSRYCAVSDVGATAQCHATVLSMHSVLLV